jgi:predicted P-loop ATPase
VHELGQSLERNQDPVIVLSGEQGSAKSTFSAILGHHPSRW